MGGTHTGGPMVPTGGTHEVLMGYSWGTHGVLMGYSWGTHGVLMGYSWGTHGVLMGYSALMIGEVELHFY